MSEYRDVLTLIGQKYKSDAIGNQIPDEIKTTVFCCVKSIRQNEFYAAATAGMQPEIMFEIRQIEYDGQTAVEHGGQKYEVMRAYAMDYEAVELVCKKVIGGVKQNIDRPAGRGNRKNA